MVQLSAASPELPVQSTRNTFQQKLFLSRRCLGCLGDYLERTKLPCIGNIIQATASAPTYLSASRENKLVPVMVLHRMIFPKKESHISGF